MKFSVRGVPHMRIGELTASVSPAPIPTVDGYTVTELTRRHPVRLAGVARP
jgi:hypothetical protein